MKKFLFGLRGNSLSIATMLTVAMPTIMIFGYNSSLAGGLVDFPAFTKQFPEIKTLDIPASEKAFHARIEGTVVAMFTVGGLFGAVSCVWFGDLLGRRNTIFYYAIIQAVGTIIMASAYSLSQLIVARLILGLGVGGLLATMPVWQSEIATAGRRGAHVATTGIFIGLGLALALFIDLAFSFTKGGISWRIPFAFQLVLTLPVLCFTYLLPESPRWLVKKNRIEEAREILEILDCDSIDSSNFSQEIDNSIRDITLSLELSGNTSPRQIFTMGRQRIFHRTLLAVLALTFLQLTGVNAITLYTSTIFKTDLHLGLVEYKVLAACYQLVSPLGGLVAILTVERFGRRKLMLLSALGNAICMACAAALVRNPDNAAMLHAATFFIYMYHFTYAIGYGGVPFLYASEIAPLHLRATINGLGVGAFWAFDFLVAEVSPTAYVNLKWKYFIVWAVLNVGMVVVVYFFFPETRGCSLEQVDQIFDASKSIFDTVGVAQKMRKGAHLTQMVEEAKDGRVAVMKQPASHASEKSSSA